MSLQDKLDAFKADFQAGKPPYNVPPTVIETMNRATAELTASGAAQKALKVAISPQIAANSRKALRQSALTYPILSDPHNDTAAAFGLRFELPDYLVELYKSLKNDLPAFNGDPSWTLPMPGRYVIAPDGTIVYAEVNPDYTRRPDPSEILPAIRKAAAGVA